MAQFVAYAHNEWEENCCWEEVAKQLNIDVSTEDLLKDFKGKIGNPFYEVEMTCDYDEITGNVTVVKAELK